MKGVNLTPERVREIKIKLVECRAIAALRLSELEGLAHFVGAMIEREKETAPTPAIEKLAALGGWCLKAAREDGGVDIDGGCFQDRCEELGVLQRFLATQPCGEGCRCTEFGFPCECFREAPEIRALNADIGDVKGPAT